MSKWRIFGCILINIIFAHANHLSRAVAVSLLFDSKPRGSP